MTIQSEECFEKWSISFDQSCEDLRELLERIAFDEFLETHATKTEQNELLGAANKLKELTGQFSTDLLNQDVAASPLDCVIERLSLLTNGKPTDGQSIELVMSGESRTNFCPISREPFTDPVSQVTLGKDVDGICKHVFQREAIEGLLKKREKIPCPVAGCDAEVHAKYLARDVDNVRRMAAAERKTLSRREKNFQTIQTI